MSEKSHVSKYFRAMNELLWIGAPVYWVLGDGIAFDNVADQNMICGGPGCDNNSLTTSLYFASKHPELYVRSGGGAAKIHSSYVSSVRIDRV